MATESASTNGQRTGQQTGDGGQAARGAQAATAATSRERGQSVVTRERGGAGGVAAETPHTSRR